MLTGDLPGKPIEAPSRKVLIDVRLDAVVLRALERRPELRYQTAADVKTVVESILATPSDGTQATPAQASLAPPRVIKNSTSTITTPERLATLTGKFFYYRNNIGHLVLDERQLTYTTAGSTTTIPLEAIREVGIGLFPRLMTPAGLNYLSVTYEEGGGRKQVIFSPMEVMFARRLSVNQLVVDWHDAVREAVIAATGRAPAPNPVATPLTTASAFFPRLTLAALPILPALAAAVYVFFIRKPEVTGGFPPSSIPWETAIPFGSAIITCFLFVLIRLFSARFRPITAKFGRLPRIIVPLVAVCVFIRFILESLPPAGLASVASACWRP